MTMDTRRLRAAMVALGLVSGMGAAQAGVMDFLFGGKSDAKAAEAVTTGRYWPIGEFSEVRIVASEPGAPPNAHPANVSAQTLTQLLGAVRYRTSAAEEPLFVPEELADIAGPLSEALRTARPGDDVQIRSSNKRGGGFSTRPYAVTARAFVLGDRLHLIVGDPRADFYFRYRSQGKLPELSYGSRSVESKVTLQRLGVPGSRGDWIEIPLSGEAAPMPAPRVVGPSPVPAGAAPAAATAVAGPAAAVPAAAAPAAAPRVRDAAFAEEVEQRLGTLKRLRDKGLITEDEYQQKRREVLATL